MDRVVVVTKPSRMDELVTEHLTEGMAAFVLESHGGSIEPYREEDAIYKAAVAEIMRQIPNDLSVAITSREELPNFLFRDQDLIIVCGPDGLFVNLAKYVGNQPVLTVNPDPRRIAGVLMLFAPHETSTMIARVQKEEHKVERLPFVKASIDDDRVIWGINDIFIGRKDQVSARYEISFGGFKERQSSSGIIVATGIGGQAWIRSIATMVAGIVGNRTPHKLSALPVATDNELTFVVREPFPSPGLGTHIVTGRVVPGRPLVVTSEMPDGGCIFSDGIVERSAEWSAGSKVTVSVGDRYIQRIIR